MTRRTLQLGMAAVLGVGAALLVACGGASKLIPAQNASQLKADFDAVAAAVASGSCDQNLQAAVAQTRTDLAALPSTIDARLASELRTGARTLTSRAAIECKQQTTSTTSTNTNTGTTPTTTTSTNTNTTTTPTTTTSTTPTTTVTTPTDTTTIPPPTTPTTTTSPVVPDNGGGTPAPNGPTGQVRPGSTSGTAGGTLGDGGA